MILPPAAKAVDLIDPRVWVIDDNGLPKGGPAWACVARQYSGAFGKVASRGR